MNNFKSIWLWEWNLLNGNFTGEFYRDLGVYFVSFIMSDSDLDH